MKARRASWRFVVALLACPGCVGCLGNSATPDGPVDPVCMPDGVKDGTETDIDCGGGCDPCLDGQMCSIGDDCLSGVCDGHVCAVGNPGTDGGATCSDGVKNQDETDVDCGGSLCDPCADGQHCLGDGDCASFQCISGVCTTGGSGGTGGGTGGSGGACNTFGQTCTPPTPSAPGTCCTGLACKGANSTCCVSLLKSCVVGAGQCCPGNACVGARCCVEAVGYCAHDYQCCSGVCRSSKCCVPTGGGCSHGYQCCSNNCNLGKCT